MDVDKLDLQSVLSIPYLTYYKDYVPVILHLL